nr:MAG TPA: hypothetical protein [Bacteriophage sp.]DAW65951.1 MAG TPA: hypothetical protein [Bacteriophage sp.]
MLRIFQCVYYLQRDYTFWLLTLHEDADFRFIICLPFASNQFLYSS